MNHSCKCVSYSKAYEICIGLNAISSIDPHKRFIDDIMRKTDLIEILNIDYKYSN